MAKTIIKISNKNFSDLNFSELTYEPVNICPCCKYAISPIRISHLAYDKDDSTYVSLFEYCNSCHSAIINTYLITNKVSYESCVSALHSSVPDKFVQKTFEKSINELSPQFTKIYNQSLAAETSELNEIAGLGYRKSLEFLVKDFSIHKNPDDEEEIKKLTLSQCIKKYIDNDQIKILVERSAWIGNDEAHYIRKQTDRDVNDMKEFIKATVYFIGMVLITEDAASMESVK